MTADFDDIEVDANGMCRWSDVANAQDIIRARIEALEVSLREIEDCLGYVKNEGKSLAIRECNSHFAWKIARAALDKDAGK